MACTAVPCRPTEPNGSNHDTDKGSDVGGKTTSSESQKSSGHDALDDVVHPTKIGLHNPFASFMPKVFSKAKSASETEEIEPTESFVTDDAYEGDGSKLTALMDPSEKTGCGDGL